MTRRQIDKANRERQERAYLRCVEKFRAYCEARGVTYRRGAMRAMVREMRRAARQ